MEVVDRGDVDGDPTKLIEGTSGDIQVRQIVLIMSVQDSGDIPGDGAVVVLLADVCLCVRVLKASAEKKGRLVSKDSEATQTEG